ncbi:MAG: NADH-quinone oxidoreductase subunit G [Burkholderiales bacterium]|nr:NADH-quinone oxidoreductase subunit G [Burkholderiales bacterium]
MLNIEIDGKATQVAPGTSVIEAATALGIYIPHFCYHKKLSIAANCRMCLVEVEKAPKPLPACATPVTEGMKVHTASPLAVGAQKGVMEFLLINHPLDCPICDQGGECQLQDLAVGYGASASRYLEAKRVVFHKDLGPLISAEEMTRCIQCTRCIRFSQEIGGYMEFGMINRGEHAEIVSFVGKTIDSELSGNTIDLCPVGALTSKPFRFTARTWELSRRKSVSPHDSLGSNLVVQVKGDRVMRVLPLENEAVNECWISDKDRFSYDALNGPERLRTPRIRQGGQWQDVDWATALDFVVQGFTDIIARHGAQALGALVSPHATLEEAALAARLVRGLGSDNVDSRLRQSDFSGDGQAAGIRWLGMPVAQVSKLERVLVVGSFLRKDHPLVAQRLRQVARKGTVVSMLHSVDDDWLVNVAHRSIVAPSALVSSLAAIVVAAAAARGVVVPAAFAGVTPNAAEQAIGASFAEGKRAAIFLGNYAEQHADFAELHAAAQALAQITGATLGFLTEAANTVGAQLAGAVPQSGGLNVAAMLAAPRQAYLVLHAEAEYDFAQPVTAHAAFRAAEMTVVLTPFAQGLDYADVLLPVSPFTETAGSFVNCEGRLQDFHGVVKPAGDTRPGWKVLRVLGTLLKLAGFDAEAATDVRALVTTGAADIAAKLDNGTRVALATLAATPGAAAQDSGPVVERVADVPIHFADPLVRRSRPLQHTVDARAPKARMHASLLAALGVKEGGTVRVRQGGGEAVLTATADAAVPPGVVRLAAAHATTCTLDGLSGPVQVERG